jgi:hypothetical protein
MAEKKSLGAGQWLAQASPLSRPRGTVLVALVPAMEDTIPSGKGAADFSLLMSDKICYRTQEAASTLPILLRVPTR